MFCLPRGKIVFADSLIWQANSKPHWQPRACFPSKQLQNRKLFCLRHAEGDKPTAPPGSPARSPGRAPPPRTPLLPGAGARPVPERSRRRAFSPHGHARGAGGQQPPGRDGDTSHSHKWGERGKTAKPLATGVFSQESARGGGSALAPPDPAPRPEAPPAPPPQPLSRSALGPCACALLRNPIG